MKTRLSDLYTLQMGKTPSRNVPEYWQGGTYQWASVFDLSQGGKYLAKTRERITEAAIEQSGIKEVPANTVVMSFKLSLGKVAITREPLFTNEAIMAFIPKDDRAPIAEYLFYQLQCHDWVKESANRAVMGVTLNKASLSKVEVTIPPKSEQERVTERLRHLDAQLHSCKITVNKLDELVKSRFIEMFGDPNQIRATGHIEDAFDIRDDLRKPLSGKERASMHSEAQYPYYGANGIVDYIDRFLTDCPAICLAEDCGSYGAGESSAYIITGKAWVNNHAHLLIPTVGYTLQYAQTFFQLLDINRFISGTTRSKLTQAQLKKIPFVLPAQSERERFENFVIQVDKLRFDVQQQIEKLETLKKSLMQEYFG